MKAIRVAITDDHEIFRTGIVSSLTSQKEINFVAEASNGNEMLLKIDKSKPDVILMDIKMPVMNGVEATQIIKDKYPDIKILALSMYDDDNHVFKMIEAGANGYLLKTSSPKELKEAISTVNETEFYFNHLVSSSMLKKLIKQKKYDTIPEELKLTEREKVILQLICEQKTNLQIGDELSLSVRTVEGYRKNLLDKTHTKNTAGLVLFAVKYGIVNV